MSYGFFCPCLTGIPIVCDSSSYYYFDPFESFSIIGHGHHFAILLIGKCRLCGFRALRLSRRPHSLLLCRTAVLYLYLQLIAIILRFWSDHECLSIIRCGVCFTLFLVGEYTCFLCRLCAFVADLMPVCFGVPDIPKFVRRRSSIPTFGTQVALCGSGYAHVGFLTSINQTLPCVAYPVCR